MLVDDEITFTKKQKMKSKEEAGSAQAFPTLKNNYFKIPKKTNINVLYGELVDISSPEIRIKITSLPCVIGRKDVNENSTLTLEEDEELILNSTIKESYELIKHLNIDVKVKIGITNCKCVSYIHGLFEYNNEENLLYYKAFDECIYNSNKLDFFSDKIRVNNFDKISFKCCFNSASHSYIMIFPNIKAHNYNDKQTLENDIILPNNLILAKESYNKLGKNQIKPDLKLSNSWTIYEKDCLRKYVLIFGYGRWTQIQKSSGGVLSDKPIMELKAFSNSFISTIIDLLPNEKSELKKFLNQLVEIKPGEPIVICKRDDWGSLINQRAPAWGKRLQLICRISILIEKFKKERKKNKDLRTKCQLTGDETDLININKTFDHWDNLLNFLPNHAFYGQRPAVWWTRTHDIDILRGTYKYGYANYQLMRNEPKFSFTKLENETSFQDFPSADTITRRLKKLIQIIVKCESNNNGIISFEGTKNNKDPTGFSLEEKKNILDFLINKGVPVTIEGKNDYSAFKEDLVREVKIEGKHNVQDYEKLIQRLRIIAQVVIQLESNNKSENSLDDNKIDELDPDNDGFEISNEDAELLGKNMNILNFIRKNILISNAKIFFNGVQALKSKVYTNIPDTWEPEIHDKELLYSVINKGFSSLDSLPQTTEFSYLNISSIELKRRLEFLCDFFKEFTSSTKQKKKTQIREIQNELLNSQLNNSINISNSNANNIGDVGNNTNNINSASNYNNSNNSNNINNTNNTNNNNHLNLVNFDNYKKKSKQVIEKDEEGNIIYPVNLSPSLKILNFGKLEYIRQNYHSEKNIFPIGYSAIREHPSMLNPKERGLYTCEILDGGEKPIFKLTPHEDKENPIIKDTCTGCWIIVCNRINDIQQNRKSKVTISGTERFGLCDLNISKHFQSFPEIKYCKKYKMKDIE